MWEHSNVLGTSEYRRLLAHGRTFHCNDITSSPGFVSRKSLRVHSEDAKPSLIPHMSQ